MNELVQLIQQVITEMDFGFEFTYEGLETLAGGGTRIEEHAAKFPTIKLGIADVSTSLANGQQVWNTTLAAYWRHEKTMHDAFDKMQYLASKLDEIVLRMQQARAGFGVESYSVTFQTHVDSHMQLRVAATMRIQSANKFRNCCP